MALKLIHTTAACLLSIPISISHSLFKEDIHTSRDADKARWAPPWWFVKFANIGVGGQCERSASHVNMTLPIKNPITHPDLANILNPSSDAPDNANYTLNFPYDIIVQAMYSKAGGKNGKRWRCFGDVKHCQSMLHGCSIVWPYPTHGARGDISGVTRTIITPSNKGMRSDYVGPITCCSLVSGLTVFLVFIVLSESCSLRKRRFPSVSGTVEVGFICPNKLSNLAGWSVGEILQLTYMGIIRGPRSPWRPKSACAAFKCQKNSHRNFKPSESWILV